MEPFYLVGPTGSGKSSIALKLAELVDGEIVNADAFQLYAGLAILTARPSREDEQHVPHHLYGVLPPSEVCHAGRFLKLANAAIEEVLSRGKVPIIVGGSGLYIKALTHGLNDMPPMDQEIRDRLDRLSLDELRLELKSIDPASYDSIEPGNRRYIQRALEISLSAGRPASELRQAWAEDDPKLSGMLLNRQREELYDRINGRTLEMFEQGAVNEVASITEYSETAAKAIGVAQIQSLLRGDLEEAECIAEIQLISRRYAKRQLTWFRREKWLDEMPVSNECDALSVAEKIKEKAFGAT